MKGSDVASASCPQEPVEDEVDLETVEFLEGVIGAVEANSFEYHSLWKEGGEFGWSWKENLSGLWRQVGSLGDMPVCLSLRTAIVRDHKIVFYHATSRVVDHRMIEDWLKATLPQSAIREGTTHLNKTDAMNFGNIFPRARQNLADAHSKSPSRAAMPKEEDTHG